MRQVPILGFRPDFCVRLAALPVGPLELQEGIDLLRAIDHDLPIHAMETTFQTIGVDTEEERAMVERQMQSDPVSGRYVC